LPFSIQYAKTSNFWRTPFFSKSFESHVKYFAKKTLGFDHGLWKYKNAAILSKKCVDMLTKKARTEK